MTKKRSHLSLFGACVLLLPVPFVVLVTGLAPVARLALLGGLTASVFVVDPDRMSGIIGGAMLAQALVWLAVLWFATRALARRLPAAGVGVIVALLALASLFPIYTTPFSSSGTQTNVFGIFD